MTQEVKIILSILGGLAVFFILSTSNYGRAAVGAVVTTIASSDQLVDFPTTYNANLASLNAGKIEISTTTLPLITTLSNLVTVGALNSGSLASGFTDVPVAVGGTGSSTPTGVLYGDGSGNYDTLEFGTSGDFLTSAGGGASPSFSTLTAHTFTSATTTNLAFTTLTAIGQFVFSLNTGGDLTSTTTSALYWDNTNGRLGLASSTPQRSIVYKSAATQECSLTDGATITFPLRECNQAKVTIAATGRTLNFSNEDQAYGQSIRLVLCQDGTGSRTVTTWDSSIRWAGGVAPTLTTTADKCDVIAGFVTAATGTPVILLDKSLDF